MKVLLQHRKPSIIAGALAFCLSSSLHLAVAQTTPTLIKDIEVGSNDSFYWGAEYTTPHFLPMADNKFFFFASETTVDGKPFISDGTTAGTKSISKDVIATYPVEYVYDAINNKVYFTGCRRGSFGQSDRIDEELYVTDGTVAGTKLVKDIETIKDKGSVPKLLTMNGGKSYFATTGAIKGFWVSDGTEAGTIQLVEKVVVRYIVAYKGKTYCLAGPTLFSPTTLYETDGTLAGTKALSLTGATSFDDLYVTPNSLYATEGGFLKVINVQAKSATNVYDSKTNGYTGAPFTFRGKDYFYTGKYSWDSNPAAKNSLFVSDGTEIGTKKIKDLSGIVNSGTFIAESFMCFNVSDKDGNKELMVSDGTAAGTLDIDLNDEEGSNPYGFCRVGNRVYFSAAHKVGANDYGRIMMITDGTMAGTKPVGDLTAGKRLQNPKGISYFKLNNKPTLFFSVNLNNSGLEPYKMEVDLVTPIKESLANSTLFKLYPNPNRGTINIELNGTPLSGSTELLITDMQGRVVYEQRMMEQVATFNLDLSAGIYFAKAIDEKGNYQMSKFVVVE